MCRVHVGAGARTRAAHRPRRHWSLSATNPSDADERGIWQSIEQIEEIIQTSPQLLQAPELQAYTAASSSAWWGARRRTCGSI